MVSDMLHNKMNISQMDQATFHVKLYIQHIKYCISHISLHIALMKVSIWHIQLPILWMDLGIAQTFSAATWMNIDIWHIEFTFAHGIILQMALHTMDLIKKNRLVVQSLLLKNWNILLVHLLPSDSRTVPAALNSFVHRIEILYLLYQTAPNHGKL